MEEFNEIPLISGQMPLSWSRMGTSQWLIGAKFHKQDKNKSWVIGKKDSASTDIPPTSADEVVGQYNKMGRITFGATHLQVRQTFIVGGNTWCYIMAPTPGNMEW